MSRTPSLLVRCEAGATTAAPGLVWCLGMAFGLRLVSLEQFLIVAGYPRWLGEVVEVLVQYGIPVLWAATDGAIFRATAGMRHFRLAFRRPGGRRAGHLRCFLRIILGVVFFPLFPFSMITSALDRYGRTLADLVAGTMVASLKRAQDPPGLHGKGDEEERR